MSEFLDYEVLGFRVETEINEKDGLPMYILHGKRGARYLCMRNVKRPDLMFLVNDKRFGSNLPKIKGYGWFSDKTGKLEPVN